MRGKTVIPQFVIALKSCFFRGVGTDEKLSDVIPISVRVKTEPLSILLGLRMVALIMTTVAMLYRLDLVQA